MLMPLTDEQNQAIQHWGGHALVCAVPGSGKSTTMRHLVARVVKERLAPGQDILVLMFNKSAQEDFREKLAPLISGHGRLPEVRTFHAKAYQLLMSLESDGVLEPQMLEADSGGIFWRGMAKNALAQAMDVREWDLSQEEIDGFQQFMTRMKALNITPEAVRKPEVMLRLELDSGQDVHHIRAYAMHEDERQRKMLRGFDDLVYDLVLAMRCHKEIMARVSNRYDLIVVDEFQDVNAGQMEMLKALSGFRAQVVAVGDDDQSIYGFRGSSPAFMTREFEKVYAGTTRYTLSHSFRFGPRLSAVANAVIGNNRQRIDKACISAEGTPDTTVTAHFTRNHGAVTAALMGQAMRSGAREVAVLVRAFHQTALVEIHCAQRGIPYRIEGAQPFYQRREIMALVGMLAFGAAPDAGGCYAEEPEMGGSAFRALLSFPSRFLNRGQLDAARKYVAEGGRPEDWLNRAAERLRRNSDGSAQRLSRNLQQCLADLAWVRGWVQRGTKAGVLLRSLVRHLNLPSELERITSAENARDRLALVDALSEYATQTELDPLAFVAHLRNLADRHEMGTTDIELETMPRPLITSWHRTKGMEFDTVILPDLAEGKTPYIKDGQATDVEEERRLFYVAMSRAIRHLHLVVPEDKHLLYAAKGLDASRLPEEAQRASPFLSEIDSWEGIEVRHRSGLLPTAPENSGFSCVSRQG